MADGTRTLSCGRTDGLRKPAGRRTTDYLQPTTYSLLKKVQREANGRLLGLKKPHDLVDVGLDVRRRIVIEK